MGGFYSPYRGLNRPLVGGNVAPSVEINEESAVPVDESAWFGFKAGPARLVNSLTPPSRGGRPTQDATQDATMPPPAPPLLARPPEQPQQESDPRAAQQAFKDLMDSLSNKQQAAPTEPLSLPPSGPALTLPGPGGTPYSEKLYGLMAEPQDLGRRGGVLPGRIPSKVVRGASSEKLEALSGLENALARRQWLEGRQQQEQQRELGEARHEQGLAEASINPVAKAGALNESLLAEAEYKRALGPAQAKLAEAQAGVLNRSPEEEAIRRPGLRMILMIQEAMRDPQHPRHQSITRIVHQAAMQRRIAEGRALVEAGKPLPPSAKLSFNQLPPEEQERYISEAIRALAIEWDPNPAQTAMARNVMPGQDWLGGP